MPRPPLPLLLAALVGLGWVCGAGAPAATASAETPDGGWRWPLAGHPVVLRPFDPPASPYGPGHRGVDLAAAAGVAVLAPGPGVVRFAGLLAGRAHRVVSGLVVGGDEAVEVTTVRFRAVPGAVLDWYVATGEWRGRAGGYAIQGAGAALVAGIEGDYLNVVGLPLARLLDLRPDLLPAAG